MIEAYPIAEVYPAWGKKTEQMGSKRKFWVRNPDDSGGRDWLFKLPTENTGEHWAEKIAYEIAREMRVAAPRVELAFYRDADGGRQRGSITESFTSEGYKLHHGNEILADMDADYDPDRKFGQSQHTIQRIFAGMGILRDASYAEQCRVKLAGYFIFDALIGNVDRHHENWGILREIGRELWRGRLAPSFDHASSLGRELQDIGRKKSRERYLHELGIESYARRARGGIFVSEADKRGPSPQELTRWCLQEPSCRRFFEAAFRELDFPAPEAVERIVARVPDGWMTPLSREFAVALMSYNHERLREIFR